MKRHGLLAAGILGSATAVCLLLNHYHGLSASEEEARSFREAVQGAPQVEADEVEDGFRINYYDTTWNRVLQDLAKHNELTLVMDKVPPGRYARKDKRRYDVDDAIRILNSELEPQGYRLLRQKQFLIVLNLDKARTEYARPQLSQDSEAAAEHRSAMDQVVRSANLSRNIENEEAKNDTEATPLLASNRESLQPSRSDSRQSSGFVTSPRTRPGYVRQMAASEDNEPRLENFGTPVRPISNTGRVVDEPSEAAATGPLTTKTITIENAKAADVARTLYVVFERRAELQKEGIDGLPTFSVYERADDGAADKSIPPMFRIGIDQESNEVIIEAPASRIHHLQKLISDLDRAAVVDGEETIKLVQNNGIKAETAKQLSEQIHQLVSMSDETAPGGDTVRPQSSVAGTEEDPAINLRGEVNVQAMQDIGILILKGNEADVEKVQEIIRRLEKISVGSLPAIHVLTLENIDSEAFSTLLTSVYEQLTELRQRGGTNRKTAAFIPVVQPNAILIISSEIERQSILELAKQLDKPLAPDFEFQVFQLKSAVASQVVTALTSFYSERPGLGTSIRAIADIRTNSVVVQGRPSELTEVKTLIERIDSDEPGSVAQMQVVPLKNAVATELATTISTAIQAVLNPPQQTAANGQGGGGNTQGSEELRTSKSMALEFLTTTGGVRDLVRSGILADVRVNADARSNSLLISAPESSMNLMLALVEALDQSPSAISEIKVFTLRNADAQQSVTMLEAMFTSSTTNQQNQLGVQLAGTEGSSSQLIPLKFSPDIRTNSVLAIGSSESLSVVEAILLRLDSDDTRQRQTTVIPLRNAAAPLVAATLLDYLTQQQSLQQNAADLFSNIERIRQEVLVSADQNSNSLIVSSSQQYFDQIVQIVEALDAQPPEVVIQALIVEVTLDSTDEFGIELGLQDPLLLARSLTSTTAGGITTVATSGTPGLNFNNTSVPLGNNNYPGTRPGNVATQGLSNFSLGRSNSDLGFGGFVFSAQSDAVSVLLRALASRRTVQVLSRPQVRATHNNEASVNVGQNVPLTTGVTQNGLSTNPQITYTKTGITLTVTPRITPDGMIAMNVFAQKSQLSDIGVPIFVNATTGDSIESPVINESTATTTVNVPNGQTIVIGGMITKSDSTLERKVPWLGDLPIVGRAFRYDGTTASRTELLIFLTPRIVLTDIDSELIKQVESERLHFIESDAEEVHGPLYSVPKPAVPQLWTPEEGTILTPEMPIEQFLEPDVSKKP